MARSRKRPGAVTGAGRHSKGFVQPQSRKAKAETDEERANGAAEEVLGVRGGGGGGAFKAGACGPRPRPASGPPLRAATPRWAEGKQ